MNAVSDRNAVALSKRFEPRQLLLALAVVGVLMSGCRFLNRPAADGVPDVAVPTPPSLAPAPVEERLVSLPTYIIEPPDILEINAIKVVPKSPYKIEALDYLAINVAGTLTRSSRLRERTPSSREERSILARPTAASESRG